jgi:sec-independent protein translocase protein TatA
MPFGIGVPELLIILVILILVFGAKRLPEAGRALGQGMREFKDSVTGKSTGEDEARELPSGSPEPAESARNREAVSSAEKSSGGSA